MNVVFYMALLGCCFLCLYRIGRGPSAPDRTVAIDILGILIVGFCGLMGLVTGKDFYLNVALAWALLYPILIHTMIITEEEHLLNTHGETYAEFCRKVPRYLAIK